MSQPARPGATAEDLRRLGDDARAEIVGGLIVHKATPTFDHGDAQSSLAAHLRPTFHRRGGGGGSGWWIVTEVEVELEPHEVYRPDLIGWRRDRVPERPTAWPVRVRPDWVCEILSPSTASRDSVKKFRTLQRCGVPHYWLVDPTRETLAVFRWQADGYLAILTAARDERVRAEPFEAIELAVAALFGDDHPGA